MINETLKQYLDDNGLKYKYIARKANIPRPRFSYMVNGKRTMTTEEYFKICDVLGISENFLRNYKRTTV